jgi:uncharacterized protein YjiS (DUF1127 family)
MPSKIVPAQAGPKSIPEADNWLSKAFSAPSLCLAWIGRELQIRSQIHELRQFDDHMLRDIGVERAGIAQFVRNGHRARARRRQA